MIVNFAERAHNHNWELDPVTRSLLDTDFYKLLMLQFIWKHYPKTQVSFSLFNRTSSVRLADMFAVEELADQMQHVRGLRFRRSELVWLAGNTFYGQRGIFEPAFLAWLERDFKLSDYELSVRDGQFHLSFDGLWTDTTMWELYALSILDEMKTRANLKRLSEFGLDVLYARAKTKLWGKIEQLRDVPDLKVADFGTRRRHSFLWQEYVVEAMAENLGSSFTGTSNAFLAHKHDLEAIGTNAHEIPMVMAALAPDDQALKASQYRVLELWQSTYEGALLIMLPDTFGTTQFLQRCPRMGGGLDRPAHRQQESLCGRGRIHRVAEGARTGIPQQADHRLRRPGCRSDPGAACLLWRNAGQRRDSERFSQRGRLREPTKMDSGPPHSIQRRLGNIADQ